MKTVKDLIQAEYENKRSDLQNEFNNLVKEIEEVVNEIGKVDFYFQKSVKYEGASIEPFGRTETGEDFCSTVSRAGVNKFNNGVLEERKTKKQKGLSLVSGDGILMKYFGNKKGEKPIYIIKNGGFAKRQKNGKKYYERVQYSMEAIFFGDFGKILNSEGNKIEKVQDIENQIEILKRYGNAGKPILMKYKERVEEIIKTKNLGFEILGEELGEDQYKNVRDIVARFIPAKA